jgi:hypothetical protein
MLLRPEKYGRIGRMEGAWTVPEMHASLHFIGVAAPGA